MVDEIEQAGTADPPPYRTVADMNEAKGEPTAGLSQSPGLRELPDSKVPGMGDGTLVSHVFGPGQTPVDPVAAGLDTGFDPLTRSSDRIITQTGTLGAGQRPSTYLQHGGALIPQAGPADHANVAAATDELAASSPGPNSTGGPAPKEQPAAVTKPITTNTAEAKPVPAAPVIVTKTE
jgi:hypothetical protein